MDTNIEKLREDFDDLSRKYEEVTKKNSELEEKFSKLDEFMKEHAHTRTDGSAQLRDHISLPTETFIEIGKAQISEKELSGQNFFGISIGPDGYEGFTPRSENSQLSLQHVTSSNQTFFYGIRPPIMEGRGATVTASTSMTLTSQKAETDELIGCYVVITSSAGSFVATRKITANTATTITVSSAFPSAVANATYTIFMPVYLGSATIPWRRLYVGSGDTEGIRFGYGPTTTGENGILYMDSSGNLYWKYQSGVPVKLN